MKFILFIFPFLFISCQQPVQQEALSFEEEQIQVASNLNGAQLYQNHCSSCHGQLNQSTKLDVTVDDIDLAIRTQSQMLSLNNLSNAELEAIANSLKSNSTPTLTGLAPSGILPGNTQSTQLRLKTDVPAICKYDIIDNNFGGMNYEFDRDSSFTQHSQMINVAKGNNYKFFVKCSSANGETSPISSVIEFKVDTQIFDTIAPLISNPLPSGTVSYNTTQVTISVDTNEISQCRYSSDKLDQYEDMLNFSETDDLSHTQDIFGLLNETEYSFYIICEDQSGNLSTKHTLMFSVEGPAAVDGAALYQANCMSCHDSLNQSEKTGATSEDIAIAILTVNQMKNKPYLKSLNAVQIEAIADALVE